MTRSDIVEINVFVRHRTERGALVQSAYTAREPVWVPLSLVEIDENDDGKTHRLHIPEWLAIQKGLV